MGFLLLIPFGIWLYLKARKSFRQASATIKGIPAVLGQDRVIDLTKR